MTQCSRVSRRLDRLGAAPGRSAVGRPGEEGVALVMVVIFSVLLAVLVADLVVTARMSSTTGQNDALLARMENHLYRTWPDVVQTLADDLAAGEEGGEAAAAGGLGGMMGGGAPGAGGGAGGEEEAEEAPPSDSANDAWFTPTAHADGEITTYVFIEDENRKFNLLTLVSPDVEFAKASRERLIRLIRSLRERTLFEISSSRATTIAEAITEWLEGYNRNEANLPRPPLKSDQEGHKHTIPLHLDELLLLQGVTKDIFYDVVLAGPPIRALPGLESVLTIYTSYRADPGDPEKVAAAAAAGAAKGVAPATGGEGATPAPAPTPTGGAGGEVAPPQPEGIGIRINVNTANRPVLRCLFSEFEISNAVIDAIVKYRNEEAPEEEGEDPSSLAGSPLDILEEEIPIKQIFNTLEDLEKVPEFANLADKDIKEKFLSLLSTESDVFSVHMACIFKRNEERKLFVMNRRRSVVVRLEGEEAARMHPIIYMERTNGLRVLIPDYFEYADDLAYRLEGLDEFSEAERKWNPFYAEFYERPPELR